MKKFSVNKNKLSDDKAKIISMCVNNVEELDVSGCQLTTKGIEYICNAIKQGIMPV